MHRLEALTRRDLFQYCGAFAAAASFGRIATAQDRLAMRLADVPTDHPLTPAIRVATTAAQNAGKLRDYSATFVKKEMVGKIAKSGRMEVKIRHEPFSVYMKFIDPHAGREVIFVEGAYGGEMQVHETGFASMLGTISLDPKGSMAMSESRYPVTMVGIKTMVEQLLEQWLAESRATTPSVQYYPNAKLGSLACRAIESTHAAPQAGLLFHKTRLYLDASNALPVRLQQYQFGRRGGQPVLVEDYAYLNMKTDNGFTNVDFDTRNPSYGF